MNRSGPRSRRPSVKLVDEYHDTKIFATKRTVGRQVIKKLYIVLKREPRFSLETSIADQWEFIRLTRNNQLIGCIKDGELKRSQDLEKVFFLSKLDLKPRYGDDDNDYQNDSLQIQTNGTNGRDGSESNSSSSPSESSARSAE